MHTGKYSFTKKALQVATSVLYQAQAVTTDMCTSSANHSYTGATVHWIDKDFKPQNKCLAVRPAPGSHTADFISAEVKSVLDDLSIKQEQLHVVTDSGANVKKAVKWRACFAQTLQLC